MRLSFLSFLWRWDGTVTRLPYALTGLVAFALKFSLDVRLVGQAYAGDWPFHVGEWPFSPYWYFPFGTGTLADTFLDNTGFFAAHLWLALPFIWLGTALTVRRLRSVGWTPWLAVLFFVPFINLAFFFLLSILPPTTARSGDRPTWLASFLPRSAFGAVIVAIALTSLLALLFVWIALRFFEDFALSVFVGIPFFLSFFSVLLYSYHSHRTFGQCVLVSFAPLLLTGVFLLTLAWEGLICLLMALPLAAPISFLGGFLGYGIQKRIPTPAPVVQLLPALLLAMPSAMWTEQKILPESRLFSVTSVVEVDAPPATVWNSVITFEDIPEPEEWFFRLGIAYPVRARIEGVGPGAVRYCEFSTGSFVEPIEIWEEPRLLRFSVTSNPPPMKKLALYGGSHSPRRDSPFESTNGEFLLEPLDNGGTRLSGTSWYRHNLWPEFYWRILSDEIIHRIHLRVLRHIKSQAEGVAAQNETSPALETGTPGSSILAAAGPSP